MSQTIHKPRARFCIEALEARATPAGLVQAALEGSFLTLQGDAFDNQVRVSQSSTTLTVTGLTGTLINGQSSVTFATPSVNAIDVKLAAGNDQITFNGVRPTNDLSVEMAAGNDVVTLNNVNVGGNFAAELGTGANRLNATNFIIGIDANIKSEESATVNLNTGNVGQTFAFDGAFGADLITGTNLTLGGDFNANTNNGNDRVTLTSGNYGGGAALTLGEGNDLARLDGVRLGTGVLFGKDLLVDTDKGDDTVTILNSDVIGGTSITMGDGIDRVTINDLTSGLDVNIETGVGNDHVRLNNVHAGANLQVNTDAGADVVFVEATSASLDAKFVGGSESDRFTNRGLVAGTILEIKEFEIFPL